MGSGRAFLRRSMARMSDERPSEPTGRPMPWEPKVPEGEPPPAPPTTPSGSGWTTPAPTGPSSTDPTGAWTPPPAAAPPPQLPGQGGLVSSAPVGWSPAPPFALGEVAPGLVYADTTSRAVAYIVDLLILGIVGGAIGALLNPSAPAARDLNELMRTADPLGTILTVLIDFGYFAIAWTGGRRATIGQRVFNIQVGNAFDGRALSPAQAIRRTLALGGWLNLIGIVPGMFAIAAMVNLIWSLVLLITTAMSATKQGLHDRFANTALVRPSGKGTSGLATACLVIVVGLLLLSLVSVIALVFLGEQVSKILSQVGESI